MSSKLLYEDASMIFYILSPLVDFANLIAVYFAEIWDFLIFIGNISSFIVVLIGAILWFTEVNSKRGKGLILGGILLAITVQYFVFFPPSFTLM
jgi:hypothetical protein